MRASDKPALRQNEENLSKNPQLTRINMSDSKSATPTEKALPNEKATTERKETWINYLAFTTVIFAALATLSTFKGGGFSSRSVVFQAQASDQWAYFQAKSILSLIHI